MRRRSAIRRALIAASIGFALPLIAASDDVVNIFSWTNYIDAKAIPSFEEKTGIKVVYDLMDSNDVLEGKLLAGKSGYDIVLPSASFFGMQVKRGLYQAIPKAKLKNYGNLDPLLLKQLDLFDPGNVYGVPYMWAPPASPSMWTRSRDACPTPRQTAGR